MLHRDLHEFRPLVGLMMISWRRNWNNPMAERGWFGCMGYSMIHPQSLRYLTWKAQKWWVSKFGISEIPGADVQVNHVKLQGCIWYDIDILDDSKSNNDYDNNVNNDNDYRKDKTYIHILIVMTLCIFLFIHSIYIYTGYTVHAAYNCAGSSLRDFFLTEAWINKSTVLGRPRVSMDR